MSHNLVDNTTLGEYIGKYLVIPFAPLKRYTDLLSDLLIGNSKKHDLELIKLLNNCLINMDKEPIRGLKKLLEIYLELIIKYEIEVPYPVTTKLNVWIKTKSIAPVIKRIIINKSK